MHTSDSSCTQIRHTYRSVMRWIPCNPPIWKSASSPCRPGRQTWRITSAQSLMMHQGCKSSMLYFELSTYWLYSLHRNWKLSAQWNMHHRRWNMHHRRNARHGRSPSSGGSHRAAIRASQVWSTLLVPARDVSACKRPACCEQVCKAGMVDFHRIEARLCADR